MHGAALAGGEFGDQQRRPAAQKITPIRPDMRAAHLRGVAPPALKRAFTGHLGAGPLKVGEIQRVRHDVTH